MGWFAVTREIHVANQYHTAVVRRCRIVRRSNAGSLIGRMTVACLRQMPYAANNSVQMFH